MKRIAIAALLGSTVLVPTLVAAAGPARADVSTVSLPTAVAVDAATVRITGTVRVSASATGLRSASLWFRYPGASARTLVGTATSRNTDVLTVTGRLDATRFTPGLNQVRVMDDVDGASRDLMLDLRRRSRVAITSATVTRTGTVALAVQTRHYDPKTGVYVASRLSPVRLEEKVAGRWLAVGSVTTDSSGSATARIDAGSGAHCYRARRPDGATVTAATSISVTAGMGA